MAVLTFSASMPTGLRLQALFSAIVDNAVTYGTETGEETAVSRLLSMTYPLTSSIEAATSLRRRVRFRPCSSALATLPG